jgi:hypothetical protein
VQGRRLSSGLLLTTPRIVPLETGTALADTFGLFEICGLSCIAARPRSWKLCSPWHAVLFEGLKLLRARLGPAIDSGHWPHVSKPEAGTGTACRSSRCTQPRRRHEARCCRLLRRHVGLPPVGLLLLLLRRKPPALRRAVSPACVHFRLVST